MKKILHQYEFQAKGFIFGDTTEVMPVITDLLQNNSTLHGPLTQGFDTFVDVLNTLWFGEKNGDWFFILAPSHYELSSLGRSFLRGVREYNDVSADIHEKRFVFADVYNLIADSIKSGYSADLVCLSFSSQMQLTLNTYLEYTSDFGPVTVICPESFSIDVAELFIIQDRPSSPYVCAPKPNDLVPFKYLYDPYRADQNMFQLNALREYHCDVCLKAQAYLLWSTETICPLCFKNRKAHRINPTLTALGCDTDSPVKLTREQKGELARTPVFPSWQEPEWRVCCNDFCQFIQRMDAKDIAESSAPIQKVIMDYFGDQHDLFINIMSKVHGPTGYLFQCLTCQAYHFYQDSD